MTAGALTISGTIKTTAIYGTPNGAQPWYFEVWKDGLIPRSYLKNGKLALKPKLGESQWILQTNNGQS
jgi:hypothetical protein